jgi:tRNA pseudouridine55 synthase
MHNRFAFAESLSGVKKMYQNPALDGIIVINKPNGITSHDVVTVVRRKFKMKRVGHAGTLDPLATGVMVMLLGKSTKLFDKFVSFDKAYTATLILGTTTDSADTQGKITEQKPFENVTKEMFLNVLKDFLGKTEQLPPMVSAVKYKGRKLYELARKGIVVERKPRNIEIYKLELLEFNPPLVKFYLECSKGTYVRQLAHDVGIKLGCGACICQIERTQVGRFSIQEAVSLEELNESHIRSEQI